MGWDSAAAVLHIAAPTHPPCPPTQVFHQLLSDHMVSLAGMLVDDSTAVQQLGRQLGQELHPLLQALAAAPGLHLTREPFWRHCLLALHQQAARDLVGKARIALPAFEGSDGCRSFVLLGAVDTTGVLREGEVYIRVGGPACTASCAARCGNDWYAQGT